MYAYVESYLNSAQSLSCGKCHAAFSPGAQELPFCRIAWCSQKHLYVLLLLYHLQKP